jgi:hypothetical protein
MVRILFIVAVLFYLACASSSATGATVSNLTDCLDLSGTYAYPGIPDYRADCSTLWLGRDDMPLPGPGGFYLSGREPALFQVTQEDCALVTLHFTAQSGPDLPMAYTMNLKPKRGKRSVEWTGTELHYAEQYVPAGMRWPGQNEWMEIDLARLPDGALRYHMVQRPSRNGRVKGEIDCTWRGAEPGQGTWFTVNAAELAYLASKAIKHKPQQQPEP